VARARRGSGRRRGAARGRRRIARGAPCRRRWPRRGRRRRRERWAARAAGGQHAPCMSRPWCTSKAVMTWPRASSSSSSEKASTGPSGPSAPSAASGPGSPAPPAASTSSMSRSSSSSAIGLGAPPLAALTSCPSRCASWRRRAAQRAAGSGEGRVVGVPRPDLEETSGRCALARARSARRHRATPRGQLRPPLAARALLLQAVTAAGELRECVRGSSAATGSCSVLRARLWRLGGAGRLLACACCLWPTRAAAAVRRGGVAGRALRSLGPLALHSARNARTPTRTSLERRETVFSTA